MAYHDHLTGLPNRRLLIDRLEQVLYRERRQKKIAAILFLDLDRFKFTNDTLGHVKADEVLKDVAKRLNKCVRKSDTVARHGGDEFIILVQDLNKTEYLSSANPIFLEIGFQCLLSNCPLALNNRTILSARTLSDAPQ